MARSSFSTISTAMTERFRNCSTTPTLRKSDLLRSVFPVSDRGNGSTTTVTPRADAPGIHVHETRSRVITDPAPLEGKCGVAQRQGIHSGYTNVDRVRLHVETIFRHARRTRSQELIAPRGAIPTNNVDFRSGTTDCRGELGKNIENMWIVVLYVARAMIA